MRAQRLLLPVVLAALAACATNETTSGNTPPASNPMTGANARPNPSPLAVGAYSATGTSDDVRGRSSGGGASMLTGRANLAGSDSGTSSTSDTSDTSSDDNSSSSSSTGATSGKAPPHP
ncbi:hypothetical protein [Lysobacter sp. HA18]